MIKNSKLEIRNSQNKKPEKFFVLVIGCQQNEHDGIKISHMLENLGLVETSQEEADLVVIVACAVRQTGVDRIFGAIKNWKDKKIITTGCVLDSDRKRFKDRGVDFWNIEKPNDLIKVLNIKTKKDIKNLLSEGAKLSSSVPIMFGCNNFCSYCATPYTRGRERSREIEQIVKDVQNIIGKVPTLKGRGSDRSVVEILLLGQNVNSYQIPNKTVIPHLMRDLDSHFHGNDKKPSHFTILLEELNALPGNFKIAFTSNHPKDMSDDIIKAVATLPKIKKEIHLPIQSGSDKILKAMNRPYTRKQYLEIIKKIKEANPNIAITTDVIIGFPGETETDFQKTADIFKHVGYKMAYINKYSPRVGTAAYKLGDPISWKEKQRRWHELDKILSRTRK
ncbi:MAG: MiaB/RimO family radical SAM methylthiotransferase [bacterium]